MGTFLSLSGVIGKTESQVAQSLNNYAMLAGGGLQQDELNKESENYCVLQATKNNTTILYPHHYTE